MVNIKTVGLFIAATLWVAGTLTWLYQVIEGLIVTDLSNVYPWGLYVSGLAFFVGNAAGGLVLSSSVYLFGATKLKPFAKLGALTAFANVTAAMLIIIPDVGQPLRLWHMIVYPQFNSVLVWDVIVLNIYALLSIAYLYILMLPDFTGRLSKIALKVENPREFSEKWAKRLAPVALVYAISIHVVTAWIFSTQGGREFWFSAALAPDFLAVAVMSGTAIVLMASVLAYGVRDMYRDAYHTMVVIISAAFFIHIFLLYNDFFIHAWYGEEQLLHTLGILFKDYFAAHAFEVIAPFAAVILLLNHKVRESAAAVIGSTMLLIMGVFVHRFLILPPAFNIITLTFKPLGLQNILWHYPIASGRYAEGMSTFVDKWSYFPTWVEIVIFMGVLAYMYFIVSIVVAFFPIIKKEEI